MHGRLKSEERDAIMSAFVAGRIPILVSTTVIEVGIDVGQRDGHGDRAGGTLRPVAAAPAARPGRARGARLLCLLLHGKESPGRRPAGWR